MGLHPRARAATIVAIYFRSPDNMWCPTITIDRLLSAHCPSIVVRGMALPRFLYSDYSESLHQKFIPKCDEPNRVRDFTGALSKSNLQVFLESEGGAKENWDGSAPEYLELKELGAGAGGEGSDSDESKILERMGEERSSERKKKKKRGNGVVVRAGGRAINDDGDKPGHIKQLT